MVMPPFWMLTKGVSFIPIRIDFSDACVGLHILQRCDHPLVVGLTGDLCGVQQPFKSLVFFIIYEDL